MMEPLRRLITVERVALLHQVEFFSGLPIHVLAAVAEHATECEMASGRTLISEREQGDCLFVIAEGLVRVEMLGRVIREQGRGDVVGDLSVLSPGPRSATVTTLSACLFLRVDAGVIDELLLDHPDIARSIIDVLVARLRTLPAADPADKHQ
jgi:CRP-like cAMP-binding protein